MTTGGGRGANRAKKAGIGAIAASLLMLTSLAQPVGARVISFGDSSFAIGTPLDAEGNRTVCSDGFEVIAISTPNDNGTPFVPVLGGPTGNVDGAIGQGPLVGVFGAELVDDFDNPGSLGIRDLTDGPTGAFTFDKPGAPNDPAARLFGFAQTEYVLTDTFQAVPDLTKVSDGEGTVTFTPSTPLPIGEEVVIVVNAYRFFPSHRRVTVVDCSEPPVELDVEADIFNNKIRPDRPWQRVRGAIINDGSFDIESVDNIEVGGAHPFRVRLRDVDHDGDLDVRFVARTRDTGVMCGDTQLTVTGTVDGEAFETTVDITTQCRNRGRWSW